MSIMCLKLVTGEEVIGEVVDSLESVEISTPAIVMLIPSPVGDGRYNVGLGPYMPYAKDPKFTFKRESVVCTFEPSADIRNEYSRIFGVGIVVPQDARLNLLK